MPAPAAAQRPAGEILAKQACVSCHAQKRKCSRQLPRCDLCQKKGRTCEYPPEALPDRVESEFESLGLAENNFPALFFLDTWLFHNRHRAVPAVEAKLPRHIESILAADTREVLEGLLGQYFAKVHPSFPVLSKLKIRRYLDSPTRIPGSSHRPDMLFLVMAVRLMCLTTTPDRAADGSTPLYRQAKECYAALEMQGVITPVLLQGLLLLTYWEVGHAVYPAAFLSVGSAVEAEEQRRVWWGILTLDRYITAGMTGRPFSCDDAQPEDLLPMLERSWDLGEPSVTPSLAACGDASRSLSAFARTCQASHLLSRVLHHTNEPPPTDTGMSLWYQDGIRLHHLLEAFSSGLASELQQPSLSGEPQAYPALGLAYTAQMLLYDAHTCANFDQLGGVGIQEQLELQAVAMAGLRTVCPAISRFAMVVRAALQAGDAMASNPLLLSCMYEAGKYYFWYYRETRRVGLLAEANEIMLTLRALATGWPLAGHYVSILEGDEFRPDPQV